MDSKCRLNKSEMQEVKRLLENFVEQDPSIKYESCFYDLRNKLSEKIQKLYEEKMEISEDIKKWFENHGANDTQYIYYSDCTDYGHRDYTTQYEKLGDLSDVNIKTYAYSFRWFFIYQFKEELRNTYNEFFKENLPILNAKLEKFNNIIKEMVIVLNSLKTAQNVLDKFGFIESINKYINTLLSQQAKPISCMTQAVENSVDNYLKQRKELDEDKK